MPQKRVLITGMSGLIGGVLRRHLEGRYTLSALNRSAVPGVTCFQADIADLEAIRPAFVGQDVVVHLSARTSNDVPWEELHQTNVVGTYNVLEAAREAGVQRVVYASSGAVTAGLEKEEPLKALVEGRYDALPERWPRVDHETLPRPGGLYGATKVWGEALARLYSDTTPLSVISLRIGYVNEEDRPLTPRQASVWCSHRDIANILERCIEAPPELRYDTFYATSDNRWGYRDLSHLREVLGYTPQDQAEQRR